MNKVLRDELMEFSLPARIKVYVQVMLSAAQTKTEVIEGYRFYVKRVRDLLQQDKLSITEVCSLVPFLDKVKEENIQRINAKKDLSGDLFEAVHLGMLHYTQKVNV